MSSVEEWIGRTDDEPFPPRVRLRILRRHGHKCAGANCGRRIRGGDRWTCDHIKALINGGQNRESNGQPLCEFCNPIKNATDVAEKARVDRVSKAHFGIKDRPVQIIPGSRLSPWKHKLGRRGRDQWERRPDR